LLRRAVLTTTERDEFFALPGTDSQLMELFAFGDIDVATIFRHRGDANRMGFALQLCLLRCPGTGLFPDADPPAHLIRWVGRQLGIDPELWHRYADRDATRRDHHSELRSYLGLRQFRGDELRETVAWLPMSHSGPTRASYSLDTRFRHQGATTSSCRPPTYGDKAERSPAVDSGPCVPCGILNVQYGPFNARTPIRLSAFCVTLPRIGLSATGNV